MNNSNGPVEVFPISMFKEADTSEGDFRAIVTPADAPEPLPKDSPAPEYVEPSATEPDSSATPNEPDKQEMTQTPEDFPTTTSPTPSLPPIPAIPASAEKATKKSSEPPEKKESQDS